MPRPPKHNVEYFSHDYDARHGKTLSILFNHFGHEGLSAWWQLCETLAKAENHIINLRNSEDIEYLAADIHFQPGRMLQILDKLAELDAIDAELYSHKIIWCQNLVNRLASVYANRHQVLPTKPTNGHISTGNISITKDDNSITMAVNTQSKVKEVKESKVKEVDDGGKKETFESYIKILTERYNDLDFQTEYEKFNLYWEKKTLKNPKLALLNWMEKARKIKEEARNNGNGKNHSSQVSRQFPEAGNYTDPDDFKRRHAGAGL
jgi:hypothetical protein